MCDAEISPYAPSPFNFGPSVAVTGGSHQQKQQGSLVPSRSNSWALGTKRWKEPGPGQMATETTTLTITGQTLKPLTCNTLTATKPKFGQMKISSFFHYSHEQLMPEHFFMLPEPGVPQDESPKDVPQLPHTAVVPATAALAEDSPLRPRGANL